jgi:hypothetical protein
MSTEVTLFEPIQAPDPRRPAMLPSLPQWAERLNGAVRLELQMTPDGKSFEKQDVLVLPTAMMPSEPQRQAMLSHQASLRSCLLDDPAHSSTAETRTATAVAKLITVLAGERKSDLADEARSEVYMDVLDDVPCWAVEAAVRRWFKHDCGTDERGKAHDYRWAPDPGTLRAIAQQEVHKLGARIGQIQRILDAREFVDCTAQVERGRLAMTGLNRAMKANPMSAASLTFEQAIALAQEPEEPVKPKAEAAE